MWRVWNSRAAGVGAHHLKGCSFTSYPFPGFQLFWAKFYTPSSSLYRLKSQGWYHKMWIFEDEATRQYFSQYNQHPWKPTQRRNSGEDSRRDLWRNCLPSMAFTPWVSTAVNNYAVLFEQQSGVKSHALNGGCQSKLTWIPCTIKPMTEELPL